MLDQVWTGMLSTAAASQAAVHPHRFAVADGSAPANASNGVKADQKALIWILGIEASASLHRSLGARQEYDRRNDDARRFGGAALPKTGPHETW